MSKRSQRGRNISGVLLLDKPFGISSNSALQKVKRLYNANKAGHTGSLDPMATGMLPICLGEATKVSAYLLDASKRYLTTVRLGYTSSTGDAEGEITPCGAVPTLDEVYVKGILNAFIGKITQIPPMYSALKRDGQPLYKLAYQGIEVEREPREVEIYEIVLRGMRQNELDLEVSCSKGTYIRTLAEDIGAAMGCGGYVSHLRRTAVGVYQDATQMLTLDQLADIAANEGSDGLDRCLYTTDSALDKWPAEVLSNEVAFFVLRGQAVHLHKPTNPGLVKLYKGEHLFLGIGEIDDEGVLRPKRLVNP